MEQNEFIEKVIGGFLGAVAIVAAVIEMALGDFSASSVAAAVKDVAGTAVVIILLVSFINEHKRAKGIRGSIENAMMQLEKGYAPMIREAVATDASGEAKKAKLAKIVRYEIAVETEALFCEQCNKFCPFFDIDLESPTEIQFYIRKMFFGEKPDKPFAAKGIFDKISQYMKRQHPQIKLQFVPDASGGKAVVSFDSAVQYEKDIEDIVSIVDDMIFVYTIIKTSK